MRSATGGATGRGGRAYKITFSRVEAAEQVVGDVLERLALVGERSEDGSGDGEGVGRRLIVVEQAQGGEQQGDGGGRFHGSVC